VNQVEIIRVEIVKAEIRQIVRDLEVISYLTSSGLNTKKQAQRN
jgi:hypothetical protein